MRIKVINPNTTAGMTAKIGGERYRTEIVSIDDQLDPKLAIAGAEQMLGAGIRYIIGPNVDTTAAVIIPLLRSNNAVNVAYGFGRYLYTPVSYTHLTLPTN